MSIYQKLIEVQTKLKAPKNQRNSFGNYNYRSQEDILEALKPVLSEVGATVFLSDEPVVKENLWCYIEATATFVDIETGESITSKAYAREPENKKGIAGPDCCPPEGKYDFERKGCDRHSDGTERS